MSMDSTDVACTHHPDHHEIVSERKVRIVTRNATFVFLPYDTTRPRRWQIATSRDDLIYVVTDFRVHEIVQKTGKPKSHATNDDVIWPQSSSWGKLRELARINENISPVSE